MMYHEDYTAAVLNNLVNQNVPLPIVNRHGERIKLMKSSKLWKHTTHKVDHSSEYSEEYNYQINTTPDIRVDSRPLQINSKLSKGITI
jgi:hypothetical protein